MSTPYVRKVTELDLPRVGQLSEALGYPVLPADLERRFLLLARRSEEALLVAELHGQVAGWAQQTHFNLVRVRSNVSRQESHQFYPALGFKLVKTQHTYVLELKAD